MTQSSTKYDRTTFVLNNEVKETYLSWDDMFQQLIEFRNVHSHTRVPHRSGPLSRWVKHQRSSFRRLLVKGKQSWLTMEKLGKLETIGLIFKIRPPSVSWETRFQELVEFKKAHGHMNVPRNSGQLAGRVNSQRHAYRLLQKGKSYALKKDRLEKLEGIGFLFNTY
eukprot:scaffold40806_cov53-Attheya_sp.AAC.8